MGLVLRHECVIFDRSYIYIILQLEELRAYVTDSTPDVFIFTLSTVEV